MLSPSKFMTAEVRRDFNNKRTCADKVTLEVNPELLKRVAKRTWDYLDLLNGGYSKNDSFITSAEFIQVYHTLIAKRIKDVMKYQHTFYQSKFDFSIPIGRSIRVPQSMAELLYDMSPFTSDSTMLRYELSFPEFDGDIPAYLSPNVEMFTKWNHLIDMSESMYRMVEFPPKTYMPNAPLPFCVKASNVDGWEMEKVYVVNREPQPAHVYQRYLHEEFYVLPPFTPEEVDLSVYSGCVDENLIEYVKSFNIEENNLNSTGREEH